MFDIAIVAGLLKILFVVAIVMGTVPITVWLERRGAGWIQGRPGPNRVGPFGLLQPLADVLKLVFKENFVPKEANKFLYYFAPAVAAMAPLAAVSVIPFGSKVIYDGVDIYLSAADVPIGILAILAFAGLEIYPILLGGWSSNNKYSSFGTLRAASQFVSYEISMGLALASMLLIYGTVDLRQMVDFQNSTFSGIILNPLAFLIVLISLFAETNRLPFDLPEGEAEIVGGYHTEYGSTKFALFFFAEYIAMSMGSAFLVTLFLGGYNLLPGLGLVVEPIAQLFGGGAVATQNTLAFFQVISFLIKVASIVFFFIWVRWSFPRFRFDQLMNLGWKILVPLSFVNLIVVAIIVYVKGA